MRKLTGSSVLSSHEAGVARAIESLPEFHLVFFYIVKFCDAENENFIRMQTRMLSSWGVS